MNNKGYSAMQGLKVLSLLLSRRERRVIPEMQILKICRAGKVNDSRSHISALVYTSCRFRVQVFVVDDKAEDGPRVIFSSSLESKEMLESEWCSRTPWRRGGCSASCNFAITANNRTIPRPRDAVSLICLWSVARW